MGNLSKNEFVAHVMNLNSIIEHINCKNCCDEIAKFFRITSELQDRAQEIKELLPAVEGIQFCGWKSSRRKKSEIRRSEAKKGFKIFLYAINLSGRDPYGHNRTKPHEPITKNKLFFGNIGGISSITIEELEDNKNDLYIKELVRIQIVRFVKDFKGCFNTNWLQLWTLICGGYTLPLFYIKNINKR